MTETESGATRWTATPPSDLTPELFTVDDSPPSSMDVPDLIAAVVDHLRHALPAWDPYAVTQ